MVDNSDETTLKLVDFGLSKMIGPNETSNDPFGTLVRSIFINFFFIVLCCARSANAETLWQECGPMVIRCDYLRLLKSNSLESILL